MSRRACVRYCKRERLREGAPHPYGLWSLVSFTSLIFPAAQSLIGGNHHPQNSDHKHSALCHGRAVVGFGNAGGFWPGR